MRYFSTILLPAALAACQAAPAIPSSAAPSPDAASPAPASSAAPTPSTVSTLEGAWRLAGIDGVGFNEPYGIAFTGNAEELWWEPRCAFIIRSYRITGTAIAFGPAIGAPKPGEMPPPVCTIAPPPKMSGVLRALDAATAIERTAENGILISGGGHSVLLFSQ
jgi:hypothetical protein